MADPDPVHSVTQLGAVLRHARQQQHLSQTAAAQAAGVERQWLNRLENGKASGASISSVLAVMETLHLQLAVQAAPHRDESPLFGDDR